jgi:ketosteroid isomerase-like protein
MSEQENVAAVQRVFEAFGRGDVESFLGCLSDDVEWVLSAVEGVVPYAGTFRGRDGVLRFLQAIGGAVEFEAFEPREFLAEGDTVAVVGFERGRVRATGKTFDNPWVLVFRLSGGKVTHFQSYEDTHAVAEAFRG